MVKKFTVGQSVKIRMGRDWALGRVSAVSYNCVTVEANGHPVYVHCSVWARDLRVGLVRGTPRSR